MGVLRTNDAFARGQNLNNYRQRGKERASVAFRVRMDQLIENYELNHPMVQRVHKGKPVYRIRTAHQVNLPKPATIYSKHGKAWFS